MRLQALGKRVALFKPLCSKEKGSEFTGDLDIKFFGEYLSPHSFSLPAPIPWEQTLGSKDLLAESQVLDSIKKSYIALSEGTDTIVAEGLPSFSPDGAPINISSSVADLMDASVLAVLAYKDAAGLRKAAAGIKELYGNRTVGMIINKVPRYKMRDANQIITPQLESLGITVLGNIPEDRSLLSVTVDQMAEHLGGRFITQENNGHLPVEHIMIGGLVLDSGAGYFAARDRKAVIVRGDRPDIQMAALRTSTSCLVLTGGHWPIQYVLNEANEENVPLILVDEDTHTTAAALNTLINRSVFQHTFKLKRFSQLLDEHCSKEAWDVILRK
jgi:BioD-like phosphotransacetylase family protein